MANTTKAYRPAAAIAYASQWAHGRNPAYADFSEMGGDCSNFISQALIAGGAVMNETPGTGWYYHSLGSRAPTWSGVPFLWQFLTTNKGRGPFGHPVPLSAVVPGDIIQLKFAGKPDFSHSLLVVAAGKPADPHNIFITAHSYDSDNRPLDSYSYTEARALHVDGVRG
jgi:hypothetical protein